MFNCIFTSAYPVSKHSISPFELLLKCNIENKNIETIVSLEDKKKNDSVIGTPMINGR